MLCTYKIFKTKNCYTQLKTDRTFLTFFSRTYKYCAYNAKLHVRCKFHDFKTHYFRNPEEIQRTGILTGSRFCRY